MDTRKAKAMDPTAEGQVYQEYIEMGMKLFEVSPIVLSVDLGSSLNPGL
jgi:hypothetical protein